ncbi:hypothetical protein T10_1465 [Trichinella papuae]|uniref:Uncharacterized protein n=1 Tax=Trichinella papuae TaxID=268474 RepID=A0A0V1M8X5_9BILA|nr:hypothetical protein T10_1465 [Trichinella papuae]
MRAQRLNGRHWNAWAESWRLERLVCKKRSVFLGISTLSQRLTRTIGEQKPVLMAMLCAELAED